MICGFSELILLLTKLILGLILFIGLVAVLYNLLISESSSFVLGKSTVATKNMIWEKVIVIRSKVSQGESPAPAQRVLMSLLNFL